MPEATASPRKVCVHCGVDCAGKQRVKDPQGNYACQPCFDRIGAGAAATPAPPRAQPPAKPVTAAMPSDDDDLPFKLFDDHDPGLPPAAATTCTNCGSPLGAGARICLSCGFDTATGKANRTQMLRPEKVKQSPKKKPYSGGGFEMPLGTALLVAGSYFAAIVGLAAFGSQTPAALGIAFFVSLLVMAVFGLLTLVSAFQSGVVHGLCVLLVPFYVLVWLYVFNEDRLLKVMYPAAAITYGIVLGISMAVRGVP